MNRRVPLWLARIAVAACGVVPFASAQETPPPVIILEDATPGPIRLVPTGPAPVVATAQPVEQPLPDHWVGVHFDVISDVIKAQLGISNGLAILEVIEGSPAQKAGIQKHDIVTTANGVAINGQSDILRVLSQTKGEPINIELVRKGKMVAIHLTPEKRPESAKPAPQGARIVIGRPSDDTPTLLPVVPPPAPPKPAIPNAVPTAPKPPVAPPVDLSQAHEWIKELEQTIAKEREAAANQLQEARKAYEETINSIDTTEVESIIKSAIDDFSKMLKDRVSEGMKALQSDDAKAVHREVLQEIRNLEGALRDQHEVPKREGLEQKRLELREERASTLESLKQEIKNLRDEIERLKREPLIIQQQQLD